MMAICKCAGQKRGRQTKRINSLVARLFGSSEISRQKNPRRRRSEPTANPTRAILMTSNIQVQECVPLRPRDLQFPPPPPLSFSPTHDHLAQHDVLQSSSHGPGLGPPALHCPHLLLDRSSSVREPHGRQRPQPSRRQAQCLCYQCPHRHPGYMGWISERGTRRRRAHSHHAGPEPIQHLGRQPAAP